MMNVPSLFRNHLSRSIRAGLCCWIIVLVGALPASAVAQQSPAQDFEETPPPFSLQELSEGGQQARDQDSSSGQVSPELRSNLIGTSLFSFAVRAGANDPVAIFRRGRNLWIIVSRSGVFRDLKFDSAAREYIRLYEDISTNQDSIVRIVLDENINPRVVHARGDLGQEQMLLYFYEQPLMPDSEISVEVEVDQFSSRPYILIADRQSEDLIEIFDPELGQRVVVMPTKQKGYGVPRQYEYTDVTIFPSLQGSAVMLKRDDLLVRRYDFGYTVNAEGNLHISFNEDTNRRELVTEVNRFVDAENWPEIRPSDFLDRRAALMRNIAMAPIQKRTRPRLELAEFYLSLGWGGDAASVLDYAAEVDSGLNEKKSFINNRLAADYFSGRYERVGAALSSPDYLTLRDAAIWRGAVMAHQQRWAEAFHEFEAGESTLRRYPARLRNRFGLLFVRAAMNVQRYDLAGIWLGVIGGRKDWLNHFERNTFDYLSGQYALVNKNWDMARRLFEQLAHKDDIINQVNARYALLSMDRREGKLDDNQMIESLSKLRNDARQLPVEMTILRQMVDVLIDRSKYLEAMRLMREMTGLDLGEEENRRLVERMQQTLSSLFLNLDRSEDVLPIRVVAIFDEFRELTPVGERGNRIINNLVNELISMDLLDQAEDMLAYQIRYRVFGQEKVLLGTKLAVVSLLNGNPGLAIKALNETQFGSISRQLGRHRRLLRANALANLGEKEEALKQLAGDISLQADLIRREIFWRGHDWSELAKTIRRLVTSVNPGATTINTLQARYIMNWIVALQMENNLVGVQEVVTQYREQMLESEFGPMFAFLVADNRRSSDDAVQRVLEDTFVFDQFLDTYQRELLDNTLDDYVLEDIDNDVNRGLLAS